MLEPAASLNVKPMRETYCFLSLTITMPLDEADVGLEPLSFTTWAFGMDPKVTLREWKRDNRTLALSLTSHQLITPTKKQITQDNPDMPDPHGAGKPRGVFAKPKERTAGKIHITNK